jgi:hypothetical protein
MIADVTDKEGEIGRTAGIHHLVGGKSTGPFRF